ncbi:MAG: hypothetical protein Q8N31_04680 [Reyranella sp.]|nr:hypothetical protein [Reyranella sp.]MDP3159287.1 hypothetical protein [Reyranella sp.]
MRAAKSKTKLVSFDKIACDPDIGTMLIRLMMVMNDCAIAEESATMWRARSDERTRIKQQEAFKFFVELQIGHLHEGLALIREIAKKPKFRALVDQCAQVTQEQFDHLRKYEPDIALGEVMRNIRNKLAFHYDPAMIRDELLAHVRERPRTAALISIGTTSTDVMFEPGAVINERVATHKVFPIAAGADIDTESNKLMVELEKIMEDFMNFGGSFVWKHTSN